MNLKCKIACTGKGYENFEVDEVRDINESLAKILVQFGYAEPTEDQPSNDGHGQEGDDKKFTESNLKKLDKAAQEEIMVSMELNPEEAKNEAERIAAIMEKQAEAN